VFVFGFTLASSVESGGDRAIVAMLGLRRRIMSTSAKRIGLDEETQTKLEAASFRRLLSHLRSRTDVQNIDLMNLSGFCRNCLSRWYEEEARELDIVGIDKATAREIIYGEPYDEWRAKYQTEATQEQRDKFEDRHR
jgi:hypothetical protein